MLQATCAVYDSRAAIIVYILNQPPADYEECSTLKTHLKVTERACIRYRVEAASDRTTGHCYREGFLPIRMEAVV